MGTLTVWKYDSPTAAEEVAEVLRRLAGENLLAIEDAAIVEWQPGAKKPRTRQLSGSTTSAGALGGAFWGMLFGLIFFIPLLGAAIGAATGALAGSLTDVGIDDDFINRVRDSVTPGTSALFVMSHDAVIDRVRDALADGPRGELIFTSLSADEEAALRQVFAE
ncbi:MAG: DUF1269 domain-containing protein [Propionicimonas sp.]|nr:DUF1269 domain-containing protein [Propionicimonas sp.]